MGSDSANGRQGQTIGRQPVTECHGTAEGRCACVRARARAGGRASARACVCACVRA